MGGERWGEMTKKSDARAHNWPGDLRFKVGLLIQGPLIGYFVCYVRQVGYVVIGAQ